MTHARRVWLIGMALTGAAWFGAGAASGQSFSIPQVLSAPFAADITAAPDAPRFAWVSNKAGSRNVWLAQPQGGRGFSGTSLTHYSADDGQEISDLAFVPHHEQLLFVRGGDIEYPDKVAPNPAALSAGVAQEIYLCDLLGGSAPRKLAEGHAPLASPDGNTLLYLHAGVVYTMPNRSEAKPEALFKLRGAVSAISFSPTGDALAFVSDRGDHSFIGVYRFADKTIHWLDPSLGLDSAPRWSADGTRIAFLRTPSTHDDVEIISHRHGAPWSIRVATLGSEGSREAYRAPAGDGSVFHPLSSTEQLLWSGDTLVFPSESDGWLHLYSVPAAGGAARLLTPGGFEIEYATASADGRTVVYAANAGDTDRRHLWRLNVASGKSEALTPGKGIETQPALLSDGTSVAFLRADVQTPAHAALLAGKAMADFMAEGLPADFPGRSLIEPKSVRLPERAGIAAHGMLFVPPGASASPRHPAVVFMHGGPVRQMLAGWHYMDYYSNAYAMNQYLASRGFVVLSLNYRAGIGYGLGFREADRVGAGGASEYNDVLAAAEYLKSRADVDPRRLGLWGGSYGGYLTALGLARNSDIFKAGVDLHGVHDWHHWTLGERDDHPLYILDTPPDQLATALAASPVADISHWRSPVLLIQGDDDHNVPFSETVRLAEALRAQGVDYSELVFPDEIHGFLRHDSWIRAYTATAQFLERHLSH